MKKIIALILTLGLVLGCAFALCSCGEEEVDYLAVVARMYSSSEPTKVITESNRKLGSLELSGWSELKTGDIDGYLASTYEYWYEELATVEEGAVREYTDEVVEKKGTLEFMAGKGLRTDGGAWNSSGLNFAPAKGDISIKLDASAITAYTYEDHKLTFTVAAANTAAVFGEDMAIDADVTVVIVDDGAVITGITIDYTIAEQSFYDDNDMLHTYPEEVVHIEIDYTYDIEEITLLK